MTGIGGSSGGCGIEYKCLAGGAAKTGGQTVVWILRRRFRRGREPLPAERNPLGEAEAGEEPKAEPEVPSVQAKFLHVEKHVSNVPF